MVAMIAREADARDLSDRLDGEGMRLCSAMSTWEALAGLRRSYKISQESARERVATFLKHFDIRYVAIGESEFEIAATAYEQFGKGRHPAALNFGDCFAYACAKTNEARLLFKGDDFSQTDIAVC